MRVGREGGNKEREGIVEKIVWEGREDNNTGKMFEREAGKEGRENKDG